MLANEGRVTLEEGAISMPSGGEFINSGTLKANSEEGGIGGPGTLFNTGTIEKTAGSSWTKITATLENLGTVKTTSGSFRLSASTGAWASGSVLEGVIELVGVGMVVTAGGFTAPNATIEVVEAKLNIAENNFASMGKLVLDEGTIAGVGTLEISKSFLNEASGAMEGAGETFLPRGATGSFVSGSGFEINNGRRFINEGVITYDGESTLFYVSNGAELVNLNTFIANAEDKFEAVMRVGEGRGSILNYGLFEKTEKHSERGETVIEPYFENYGAVVPYIGQLKFSNPVNEVTPAQFAEWNSSHPHQPHPKCGDPVNCATGNFYETQTDLSVGGRGVGLNLTRTYNSQAAAEGGTGIFGHGWSSSFTDHVTVEKEVATVYHGNGSAVPFAMVKGGGFASPKWTQDKLTGNSTVGYSLIQEDQVKYEFEGSTGRLESVTDRNGNETTLAYNKAGQLETITDPDGRKITLAYNKEGLVESAKDPMGHTVKYEYEEGTLASVTLPGETKVECPRFCGHA